MVPTARKTALAGPQGEPNAEDHNPLCSGRRRDLRLGLTERHYGYMSLLQTSESHGQG